MTNIYLLLNNLSQYINDLQNGVGMDFARLINLNTLQNLLQGTKKKIIHMRKVTVHVFIWVRQ